ncbi:MAG: AAA family ATPase, partial [Nocardioidaceae bacterium]
VADRADLMVWLDPPVPWTMWQVARRTVTRRVRGVELWNGNREGPLREVLSDPEHVIRYAWSTRHRAAARVEALLCSHPRLPVVRLRSRRQVGHWLRGPLAEVTHRR